MITREYNEETGVSTVVIEDEYGITEGFATLKEEDRDLESPRTGIAIAELKALIEHEEKKEYEIEAEIAYLYGELEKHQEQTQKYELELTGFLKGKEEFRKNYRKMKGTKKADLTTPEK